MGQSGDGSGSTATLSSWSSQLPWVECAHNILTKASSGMSLNLPLAIKPLCSPPQEIQDHLCCCRRTWRKAHPHGISTLFFHPLIVRLLSSLHGSYFPDIFSICFPSSSCLLLPCVSLFPPSDSGFPLFRLGTRYPCLITLPVADLPPV